MELHLIFLAPSSVWQGVTKCVPFWWLINNRSLKLAIHLKDEPSIQLPRQYTPDSGWHTTRHLSDNDRSYGQHGRPVDAAYDGRHIVVVHKHVRWPHDNQGPYCLFVHCVCIRRQGYRKVCQVTALLSGFTEERSIYITHSVCICSLLAHCKKLCTPCIPCYSMVCTL